MFLGYRIVMKHLIGETDDYVEETFYLSIQI